MELNSIHKDILWTMGVLDQLRDWGLISGGCTKLKPQGQSFFEHNEDTWKPTDECIRIVLTDLDWSDELINTAENMIICYRDDKERMLDFVKRRGLDNG